MVMRGVLPNDPSKRFYSYVFGIVVVFCYLWLAIHIVMNGGYQAQDNGLWFKFSREILFGTSSWVFNPSLSEIPVTNPPLLYILGAISTRTFGDPYGFKIVAMLLALLNLASLYLLWRLVRPVLSDSWNLWFVAFMATLPAYVITSVVYAPDALTILPFLGYCALNIKLVQDRALSTRTLVASCIVQIVGGLSKLTFVALGPASFFMAVYLASRSSFNRKQKAAIIFLIFLIPFTTNMAILKWYGGDSNHSVHFPRLHNRMALRSLLPYSRDIDIFNAPGYFDPILEDGKHIGVDRFGIRDGSDRLGYRILVDNRYSQPALLHLGIYTDIMNIAFRFHSSSDARSPQNQFFQKASVILGIVFSSAVLFSNICFVIYAVFNFIKSFGRDSRPPGSVVFFISAWLPAECWYLLIVGSFPFMNGEVYWGGYWLPRLVIAPLIIFGAIGFWGLEKLSTVLPIIRVLQIIIAVQMFFNFNLLLG
jgi:4-amino-4-deoxy-L-arabinose transferase-like glycosyltransferase